MWPKAETTVTFGGHKLVLKPATRETDQSVHINLRKISDVDALTLINRFLSVLAWCDDQPMENGYGWSGNPLPVAVPRERRATGSSIAFPFCRDVDERAKVRLALALFREGRSVNSVPFAFLSYFKILNMFWKDKYVGGRNALVEGIRTALGMISDKRVSERIQQLQSTEPDIPKYLYESGRCAIAHAHSDPIVDPDDVRDLRRLSQDIHVIKAIAEHLIEVELGVSRSTFA
jgi:hypothetical protein